MRTVFSLLVAAWLVSMTASATAADACAVPRQALQYRATLIRSAHALWGLDAPVAVFAAQIHVESRWNMIRVRDKYRIKTG